VVSTLAVYALGYRGYRVTWGGLSVSGPTQLAIKQALTSVIVEHIIPIAAKCDNRDFRERLTTPAKEVRLACSFVIARGKPKEKRMK